MFRRFILFIILFVPFCSAAQITVSIDSAWRYANAAKSDTEKFRRMANMYDNHLWRIREVGTFKFLVTELELARRNDDRKGLAKCYSQLSGYSFNVNNLEYAIKYNRECMIIRRELGDSLGIAGCFFAMGRAFGIRRQIDSAEYYYLRSESIFKRNIKDPKELKDKLARVYTAYGGSIYGIRHDTLSIYYVKLALQYRKENDYYDGIVASSNVLASILDSVKDYNGERQTISYLLYRARNQKDSSTMSSSMGVIGHVLTMAKQFDSAKMYLDSARLIARQIRYDQLDVVAVYRYAEYYEAVGQPDSALKYFKLGRVLEDKATFSRRQQSINEMQTIVQMELEDQKIGQKDEELRRQRNVLIIVSALGLALVIVSVITWRNYRAKKRVNRQLEEKNAIIEEYNKNVTDSINYAQKIQEAVFPPRALKQRLFPDSFVLYKPRDIVSGDFYWFEEKNNFRFIAAVDCTGHGVPGAFMSMLGNAFLIEIVKEKGITQPAEILAQLREHIILAMKQDESVQNKDGMDIALCAFEEGNRRVHFAGAHNPLWIIRNHELIEIAADKQPVGLSFGELRPFTPHTIDLQPGDCLYIFTDGYADQFGGERKKKFMRKKLRELFLSIHHLPMPRQEETLIRRHLEWKGNLEQVDDMLVIGIRV